jgi:enoyl-CoA hydratase/carnithine racemase
MLLRRRFDAAEALALGVITDVVPEGTALERALECAAELAALPPLAVETIKRAADLIPEASREAAMLIERLGYAALAQTDEATKAIEDFTRRDRRP